MFAGVLGFDASLVLATDFSSGTNLLKHAFATSRSVLLAPTVPDHRRKTFAKKDDSDSDDDHHLHDEDEDDHEWARRIFVLLAPVVDKKWIGE